MTATGQTSTFDDLSAAVARVFLQTAVVVDDQAFFTPRGRPVPLTVREPGTEDAIPETGDSGAVTESSAVEPIDWQHNLDAKRLIDAFAEHGLICAVLRPEQQGEPLVERTITAARRTDLLILDWQLHRDNGDRTMEIIQKLVEADQGRLRMIAIYTGDENIERIADTVAETLGIVRLAPGRVEDRFVLRHGPMRVAVFAKDHVHVPPGAVGQKLTVEQLPERLIAEFSAMTAGLVSNVALAALTVLRDNTHPLLATLHPGLDAPYLTQRALLAQPDDAAELLVALVIAELRSILDDHGLGDRAGMAIVGPWLEARHPGEFVFKGKDNKEVRIPMEDVREWLRTANRPEPLGKRDRHDELTGQFCQPPAAAAELDAEFAVLTALRTRYMTAVKPPMLTLGTIVAENPAGGQETTLYWLCIQPQCDCVRLTGERAFPFLPYAVVTDEKESFGLTIKERDGRYVRLALGLHPYLLRMVPFMPRTEGETVIAAGEDADQGFVFDGRGARFRWIAELKHEQAQRVANDYAATLARPGVDESEWLRRSAR